MTTQFEPIKPSIQLKHQLGVSDIFIGSGLLKNQKICQQLLSYGEQFVILTDDNRPLEYAKELQQQLTGKKSLLMTIPAGEKSKTRAVKQQLEDQILANHFDRSTVMIAVGGGVVTDLAGFISATYLRGIRSVYLPTTLLAMVDAAIGGKTGVNTPLGKNLIGSFHQPKAVFCDIDTLKTLPEAELNNGLVETMKHALIKDALFFAKLVAMLADQLLLSATDLEYIIHKSCQIKCDVVSQDEQETKGLRQSLNFGHTIAHGLENVMNYQISHGQAVLVGMWIESYLSLLSGDLSEKTFDLIDEKLYLIQYSKPIVLQDEQLAEIKERMIIDKKSLNQQAHFVKLATIGKVYHDNNQFSFPIADQLIDLALEAYRKRKPL